ncbi:hypothetical protein C173_11140 [Paenibacillus sp. FSL R7-277]|uniref:hypothetical protein n=1 Tax=Paenibacillus sp. FSL R7-277 TaxID=1227352 RepID=UPI0003E1C975|nr:hypothetical protein [Paenibacillus sp. FSL R7-277]ETT73822.1 hypothetical protein C173_11140 [Paenibacillus sp. FSL R7-277]
MKSFEKELRRRIVINSFYAAGMGITVIVAFILKAFVWGRLDTLDSWDIGILAGLLFGSWITAALRIARLRKVLKDPETLEASHIAAHDERNRMIALKTGRAAIRLFLLLLSLSAVVASLINQTVFLTIAMTLVTLLLLYLLLSAYYSRKI